MRLVWHIVKKDLRRIWPWLLVISCASLVRRVALMTAFRYENTTLEGYVVLDDFLLGAQILGAVLGIAALVHEDNLVEGHVFWVTRPISGGRLLAAKLASAMLGFVLLPMVLMVGWWLYCGFQWRDMAASAPLFLLREMAVVLGAFVFTVISRGLVNLILSLVGVGLLLAMMAITTDISLADTPMEFKMRIVFSLVGVGLLGATVGIVNQYLTRRTFRTIAVFLLSLLGAWGVFQGRNLTAFSGYRESSEKNIPAFAEKMQIVLKSTTPVLTPVRSDRKELEELEIKFWVTDVPSGYDVAASRLDFFWGQDVAGQKKWKQERVQGKGRQGNALIPLEGFSMTANPDRTLWTQVEFPKKEGSSALKFNGCYLSQFDLRRPELANTTPMVSGKISEGLRAMRIVEADYDQSKLTTRFMLRYPRYVTAPDARASEQTLFVELLDMAKKKAVWAKFARWSRGASVDDVRLVLEEREYELSPATWSAFAMAIVVYPKVGEWTISGKVEDVERPKS